MCAKWKFFGSAISTSQKSNLSDNYYYYIITIGTTIKSLKNSHFLEKFKKTINVIYDERQLLYIKYSKIELKISRILLKYQISSVYTMSKNKKNQWYHDFHPCFITTTILSLFLLYEIKIMLIFKKMFVCIIIVVAVLISMVCFRVLALPLCLLNVNLILF